jgi:hypothetical protein
MPQAHAITDVRPIETGYKLPCLLQRQALDNFLARARIGRGRQRNARHVRKALMQHRQLAILRPKIVPPLRHAVRLVNREQRHLGAFQQIEKAPGEQPLRRHVKQVQLTCQQLSLHLALLIRRNAGVEKCRGHARLAQRVDLILHQRNQRRHHNARALPHQRRNLITQRLAAAGWHQHQRITTLDHMVNDGLLLAAEIRVTENSLKNVESVAWHPLMLTNGRYALG